jgi:hypothetical protein
VQSKCRTAFINLFSSCTLVTMDLPSVVSLDEEVVEFLQWWKEDCLVPCTCDCESSVQCIGRHVVDPTSAIIEFSPDSRLPLEVQWNDQPVNIEVRTDIAPGRLDVVKVKRGGFNWPKPWRLSYAAELKARWPSRYAKMKNSLHKAERSTA